MSTPVQRNNVLVKTTLLALALLVTLAGCVPEGIYWLFAPRQRVDVIVPSGFEGYVLIAYQVPDGAEPVKEGDVYIYRIPEDGVLLLQSDPPSGVGQFAFYYEVGDGSLRPIPPSTCFDHVEHDGSVVCVTGTYEVYNTRQLRPSESYFVGSLDKWRDFRSSSEKFDSSYEQHLDKLALPEN
ncbi:MAG: hypothetical protein WAZ19_09465 [Anaerolineae bacterium]